VVMCNQRYVLTVFKVVMCNQRYVLTVFKVVMCNQRYVLTVFKVVMCNQRYVSTVSLHCSEWAVGQRRTERSWRSTSSAHSQGFAADRTHDSRTEWTVGPTLLLVFVCYIGNATASVSRQIEPPVP